MERINEVFHSNGTVSYDTKKLWFFLEEESASLESPVTTVDVPILAAAEFVRGNWFQVKMNFAINIVYCFNRNMDDHCAHTVYYNIYQLDSWTAK